MMEGGRVKGRAGEERREGGREGIGREKEGVCVLLTEFSTSFQLSAEQQWGRGVGPRRHQLAAPPEGGHGNGRHRHKLHFVTAHTIGL